MTKKKIDNPKVFISYAWGDEEYQNQVLALATQLVGDGIDVVLDKWDLTEGNDTYAFMEKCATDPTITNVLMLLDPIYAKKADEHTGGVGTETQIISAKVYQEVTQDKFIPVIMQRDEEGNVSKPTYLQGRLHFDLSIPERFDKEYQRLVKKLYGEEVSKKPEIGNKPEWVEKPISVAPKTILAYDGIKRLQTPEAKRDALVNYLDEIIKGLLEFANKYSAGNVELEDYIDRYDETNSFKLKFLQLIKESISVVPNCVQLVAERFEDLVNSLPLSYTGTEIVIIRIHELFLYVVAYLLRSKNYSDVGYLLGKTYYSKQSRAEYGVDSYHMFYSGSYHYRLDSAIKKRDDKAYFTGTGQYWIETINTDFCTKEQFVLADLICYNYSVYGSNYTGDWLWFPIIYCYDNRYSSKLEEVSKKLVSLEFAKEIATLFGYENVDDLIKKMSAVEKDPPADCRHMRYAEAFESPKLLGNYIKAEDVGRYR